MGAKPFGASVRRREDRRLLTGGGRYVDDLTLPDMLHAAFLRSPHAHALIRSIDVTRAEALPGVAAVFTFARLAPWMRPLPMRGQPSRGLLERITPQRKLANQYPLANDRVRYVGEIVAMVVATDRARAEDALDLVAVDYAPLPAVVDTLAAGEPGAAVLHEEWGDNVALEFADRVGAPEEAFARADVVVRERFHIQRYVGMPLETRGVLARYDPYDGTLTNWANTQIPHWLRQHLARALDLPLHRVRVVAHDVGGGFGTKAHGYAEDVLVPLAARELGRPVKWLEDRHEHFQSAAHAREQVHDIAVAAARDGVLLGLRDRIWVDTGAYNLWHTLPYNTVGHLVGPHRIPNVAVELRAVVTNKMPFAPYRGAGRPEAVFAVDRILDRLARELRHPAELRRRNYIRADEMPYDTRLTYMDGTPAIYDGGDYPAALEQALDAVDHPALRARQTADRARGVYRGVGISGYVEGAGLGPYETASVRIDTTGRVLVAGAASQGQGHETTFAQVAADALGVPLDWITVVGCDTAAIPLGTGTYASRGAITAGISVADAARQAREQVAATAAHLLEVAADDVVVEDGMVFVGGAPGSALSLAQVMEARLPSFFGAGLGPPIIETSACLTVPTVTYASAVHVAVVEVDPGVGGVRLLRYVVAHDCGQVINPRIVEGQIHGGVAQGIGGALLEELVYDEHGQLLGSFLDYLLPGALDVPSIETLHLETPSPRNPLGVKGIGEGGAISPPAAIANAIEDALAPFGITITRTPVTPNAISALLDAARAAAQEQAPD